VDDVEYRKGVQLGVGAYLIWGLVPLYFKLLKTVVPWETVAHRILWSVVLLVAVLAVTRRLTGLRAVFADASLRRKLTLSAVLIAINWLIYIWAVVAGKLLAASLGYFLNPLVNVALGVAVLGERLTRLQKLAVGIAAVGVVIAAAGALSELWISISLALSFGCYGLVRKQAPVPALEGLAAETIILAPVCAAGLAWLATRGGGLAFGHDPTIDLLLIASAVVTSVPLVMFAGAVRRLPYATLGVLQYVAPSIVFVLGVTLYHEPLRPALLAAFVLIWAALAVFSVGLLSDKREAA